MPTSPVTPEAIFVAEHWHAIDPLVACANREAFRESAIVELNLWGDTDPEAAAKAVRNAAATGLYFGRTAKLLYLTPFRDNRMQGGNGRKKLQVVVGYRGFIELAFAGNFLKDLHSDVIYQGETFRYWCDETGPRLEHEIPLGRTNAWEGIVGSYCLYHTRSGGRGIAVCSAIELAGLRKTDIWRAHPVPMSKKTAVRRASNEWQQVPQLRVALMLEDYVDREEDQPDLAGGPVRNATVPLDLNNLGAD